MKIDETWWNLMKFDEIWWNGVFIKFHQISSSFIKFHFSSFFSAFFFHTRFFFNASEMIFTTVILEVISQNPPLIQNPPTKFWRWFPIKFWRWASWGSPIPCCLLSRHAPKNKKQFFSTYYYPLPFVQASYQKKCLLSRQAPQNKKQLLST